MLQSFRVFFSRNKEIKGIAINVEGVQLHSNECTKPLGVHVDRYLTFNYHVSDTKKVEKVQERALCFIYRKFESDYINLY